MTLALVDGNSAAYNVSYLMGRVVGILILVILVLWIGKKIFGRK
ncbi:MAG TPA: hypothetical protein VEB22_14085 [Phycisphaerales bacterium]|nr:hypothetical protein [Phycisphaerales bacterium]